MTAVVRNDEARLAEAMRRAGVEVGSVGGDHFLRVVAGRLLAGWLGERLAEAWTEGRESVGLDMTSPIGDDGMRRSTPNPYRGDPA